MFPLRYEHRPDDRERLAIALREGLQAVVRLPADHDAVHLEGDAYPKLDRLRVDLTGADALTGTRSPAPPRADAGERDVHVGRLEITAHPLVVEGARVWVDLRADDADFGFRRDGEENPWLVLVSAREGWADVRLPGSDFETLLLAGLKAGAARQGVRVEGVRWDLQAVSPRTVALEMRITAVRRVVLADVRATVRASGRVEIDDRLDATVRDLRVEGEGPVGGVVANLAAPYVRRFDGRTVRLTGLPLGVELRDVRVDASDGLRVTASFG